MATNLPTDVAVTYPDRDPGDALHQQHHDQIHAYTNTHDTAADPHGDRAYADGKFLDAATADVAYVQRGSIVTAEVGGFESTTSTTFADLATLGPTLNVTVGSSGQLFVMLQSWMRNSDAGQQANISFELSGANTLGANLDRALVWDQDTPDYLTLSGAFVLTGLAAGATTIKAKYWVQSGTGTYGRRRIIAIPF